MASHSVIPTEVIEIIVDHLQHHHSALLACHRTSRAFLSRTRSYLFASTDLEPRSTSFFLEHEYLIPFIRRVCILSVHDVAFRTENELVEAGEFLRRVPTLEVLRVLPPLWNVAVSVKKAFAMAPFNPKPKRSTWRKLRMKIANEKPGLEGQLTAETILSFLRVVDARQVELLSTSFEEPEDYREFLLSFPSLTSFRIDSDVPMSHRLIEHPSATAAGLQVKVHSLSMTSNHFPENSTLLDYSELVSLSLKPHLSGFGSFFFLPTQIIASSRATLQHLCLDISGAGWVSNSFKQALDLTEFPSLNSVEFKSASSRLTDFEGNESDGIDVLLQMLRPIRAQLKKLNIVSTVLYHDSSSPATEMSNSFLVSLAETYHDWGSVVQKVEEYELSQNTPLLMTAEFRLYGPRDHALAREVLSDIFFSSIPPELCRLPRTQFQWDTREAYM